MTDLAKRESEFLLYIAPNGAVKVSVLFRDETAWLTQRALAELFGDNVPAITKHLKNIFESGELDRAATISKMEIVQTEDGQPQAYLSCTLRVAREDTCRQNRAEPCTAWGTDDDRRRAKALCSEATRSTSAGRG